MCQCGTCRYPLRASNCGIFCDVLIAYSFILADKETPRNMKNTTPSHLHRKAAPSLTFVSALFSLFAPKIFSIIIGSNCSVKHEVCSKNRVT